MRIAALGGVIGPVLFTIVTILSASGIPGYQHTRNFISELGATGAENAALMNYAGFIPGGLLIAMLGIALAMRMPRDRVALLASVLVFMFGLGITLDGIFSCDLGCPQGSGTVNNIIHNAIAPAAFLLMIIACILFGIRWRQGTQYRVLSGYSIASGIVAFGFFAMLVSSLDSRELTGLWQRLMLAVFFLWCIVVGWRLARRA